MRILLIMTDLYAATGGGQTVYRGIVERTPECQFHYFLHKESRNATRPRNAHGIPLLFRRRVRLPGPFPEHRLHALEQANQFARSVAGQRFDIADIPDFLNFGAVLRTAFAHHGVAIGKLVLALHGNCSTSRELNWGTENSAAMQRSLGNERMLEEEQFDSADGAYGLSPRYIREWEKHGHPIHFIDPLHFLPSVSVAGTSPSVEPPSLYCVGRSERRKGNDIFVELLRWLRSGSFAGAAHIGDEDFSHLDHGSSKILAEMARRRGVEISYRKALAWPRLHTLYQENSILVLPVRYDSLNLVALEALFSGCPVAISSRAGVCDYLDTHHPSIPYVKIDFDNLYSAVGAIQDLIDRYPEHRQRLRQAMTGVLPSSANALNMAGHYRDVLDRHGGGTPGDVEVATSFPATYTESHYYYKGEAIEWVRRLLAGILPPRVYSDLRKFWLAPRQVISSMPERFSVIRLAHALGDAATLPRRIETVTGIAERPGISGQAALDTLYDQARGQLFRCNFYREIAQVERNLGHEMVAVAYELRILRLLGEDRFGLLPRLVGSLRRLGFPREAEVATAMYADLDRAEEQTYAYLRDAQQRHLSRCDKPFAMLDDRRSGQTRVAIIVSLYKAAAKLEFFLTALANQTLVRQGRVEIILVDSGSPDGEHEVIDAFLRNAPLNVLYARSAERETIQAAWNRGIGLSTSPYLVFLGVDETLYPEALEVLAGELDKNPDTDWVMANSLVTSVNKQGVLEQDVMIYDRAGATPEHVYLETCYLSWVGGMYRKSIHDRHGYYDETFRAAGDTEFKNRVLPGIKVRFMPRMLGLFLNYPDERTTAGPLAEIEDLRAWYAHRTPAGIRYALEQRPLAVAQQLLGIALGYRKSYCSHISSDIDYASHLADYLVENRDPADWVRRLAPGLRNLLRQLRQFEYIEHPLSTIRPMIHLFRAKRIAAKLQTEHTALTGDQGYMPRYTIHNDNRYEQHSWLWKSHPGPG